MLWRLLFLFLIFMETYKPNKGVDTLVKIAFWLILTAGLFLRLYQYFINRSLWEDEAHLALNFVWSGYIGLVQPLANFQSAPVLFLFSVETFTKIFGYSEYVLRAFPLIISLAAYPLFYYFVYYLTRNRLTALIAFAMFAANISLIYYSSELKPYTVDVSVYIVMGYLLVSEHAYVVKNRNKLLIIAGCLSALYANAAVVVLFCSAWYMAGNVNIRFRKDSDKGSVTIDAPMTDLKIWLKWFVVFLFNYIVFVFFSPYSKGMKEIWSAAFCPVNIFSAEFRDFIKLRIDDTFFIDLFYFTKEYYFPQILCGIAIIALVSIIYRKQYKLLLFTVVPVLLHLVLSMFKMYPFFYRFILYLLPAIIIYLAIGLTEIATFLQKKIHFIIAIPVIAFSLYATSKDSFKRFPSHDREAKPVLNWINKHGNEKLYVTTSWTLYQYYQFIKYVKDNNVEPIDWNIAPDVFYDKTAKEQQNYLLFYSASGVDGYQAVLADLQQKGLVADKFEYGTYGVIEIKPLPKP